MRDNILPFDQGFWFEWTAFHQQLNCIRVLVSQ